MTDKYEFIDAGYATVATDMAAAPTVMRMCEWLQISKSGFYEWRSRPESATAKRREMLKTKIRALFKANDSTYGYRRMHAALARGGEQAGLELVRALMRELGLVPCQPRPWRPSTTRQGAACPIPDLVRRDFSAARPGEKMVGDITYIPTWQGKHSPHVLWVICGSGSAALYGEIACAGGCQGVPSMRSHRTAKAFLPCLRAVSM